MTLFVQESPTRIRIVNPRYINLAAYGSTLPFSVANATPLGSQSGYSGWGYDSNLQRTSNWIIASFFNGVGSVNGGNTGGPAQDLFVNLQPGRYYCFKAFAFGSDTPEVFELDTRGNTAPWEPGNLQINNWLWDYPTLSWISNSNDHTGFEILREKESSPGSGVWGSPITFTVGPTILTYRDSSIGTGNYRYSVRAVNSFGQSPYCFARATGNIATAFPTTAPTAPSNVNVVISGTPLSCSLSWTDNSNNEGMFIVSRQVLSGTSWVEDMTFNIGANTTAPQFRGDYPTVNGTYRFTVTAINAAGSSAAITSNSFNVGGSVTVPAAPSNCVATVGVSSVTVTWTDNSTNETSFEIHRQTLSGTIWGADVSVNTAAGVTSYVDSTVSANTYRYQVRATNSAGPSAYTAFVTAVVASGPTIPVNAFLGQYYSGMNFATLLGNRTDPAINFSWGTDSPMAGVPVDLFSVRWTGDWDFAGGTYTFTATADDGIRVYVDGTLLIDQWIDQAPTTYTANKDISAGRHRIVVEYYENAGGAVAQVSWQSVATVPTAPSNLTASIV